MQSQPIFDLEGLRAITGGDTAFESELAGLYNRTATRCLLKLQALVEQGDAQEWHDTLHELKGASSNLRAERMVALCTKAYKAAPGEPRETACGSIMKAYEALLPHLRRLAAPQSAPMPEPADHRH